MIGGNIYQNVKKGGNKMITGTILLRVCWQKKLNATRADKIANLLNGICPSYGINTPDIMHEFLANLLHECAEFTRYEESLNYSSVALQTLFGRHRISLEDANRYGRHDGHPADQKAIGNIIYGGHWGLVNLGNTDLNDGYNFRGSGPIQMTGRGNFTAFGNYMDKKFGVKKDPIVWAELLRTNDEYAIHSACWIFAISKSLIDEAINDDLETIRKRINGGVLGMAEVKKYNELCKQYIT